MDNIFKFSALLIVLSFRLLHADAQPKKTLNYAGIIALADLHNLSTAAGFEYERKLRTSEKFILSCKTAFIVKYRSQNSILVDLGIADRNKHYNYDGNYIIQLLQFWCSGNYFTSAMQEGQGFFFGGSFGLTYSTAKKINQQLAGKNSYKNVLPGIETNFGLVSSIARKHSIRLSFFASFSDAPEAPFPGKSNSPLLLVGSKFSFGF